MIPILETERTCLRAFTKTDVPVWYQWFNDPEVTEHMNKGGRPNTEVSQEDFLRKLSDSGSDVQFAIVDKDSDELIGAIGIHKVDWVHRHGDISVVLGNRKYWGKGVGAEAIGAVVRHAFTKLNFHKLTAGMWSVNSFSRKAFEKNGFRQEGQIREQYYYKDGYVDEIRLGLLRVDWAETQH